MAEGISIKFVDRTVTIQYHPATTESTVRDEAIACEMAMQVLAAHSIELRRKCGVHVPGILLATVEAHTFHDLLDKGPI